MGTEHGPKPAYTFAALNKHSQTHRPRLQMTPVNVASSAGPLPKELSDTSLRDVHNLI